MERDHVLVAKDKRILTYKAPIDSKSISRESLYVHDVDGVNSSEQKWPFDEKYDILGSVSHPALLAVRHLASRCLHVHAIYVLLYYDYCYYYILHNEDRADGIAVTSSLAANWAVIVTTICSRVFSYGIATATAPLRIMSITKGYVYWVYLREYS